MSLLQPHKMTKTKKNSKPGYFNVFLNNNKNESFFKSRFWLLPRCHFSKSPAVGEMGSFFDVLEDFGRVLLHS